MNLLWKKCLSAFFAAVLLLPLSGAELSQESTLFLTERPADAQQTMTKAVRD